MSPDLLHVAVTMPLPIPIWLYNPLHGLTSILLTFVPGEKLHLEYSAVGSRYLLDEADRNLDAYMSNS